ncbi:MAG: SGNH/GDSL hydrolase family protein [Clostridia bacterium]|nr:SGNH/GDSL hydrolase family protein [Clostridia bacterium]
MSIKVIPVIGDSHTWGEGVGAERSLDPAVCCGDLRPLPFTPPCYVNLLRDRLNTETGSSCSEYEGEALTALCEGKEGAFGVVSEKPLTIDEDFDLARIFFYAGSEEAEVKLTASAPSGDTAVTEILFSDTSLMSVAVKVAHIMPKKGETAHRLTATCGEDCRALVYRVELYRGPYALLNCGIGSCPTKKFVESYFDRYVAPLSPYAILFEGCTINDWLCTPTDLKYAAHLRRMLSAQRDLTSRVLWHTVTPIGGSQISRQGTVYTDYVNTMRSVAAEAGVALVDCNAEMAALLAPMSEAEQAAYFYHDPWHPNGEGHRLYAELIWSSLKAWL